jgi:predicted nuclease with TOPRIM domain
MKTQKLETIVLVLAGIIIIVALIFIFALNSNPNSSLWVNILLASGFLLYIVYNVMTSSNYNKQVSDLEDELAAEVTEKETALQQVASLTTDLNSTQQKLSVASNENEVLSKEKEELSAKVIDLESALQELEDKNKAKDQN